MRRTLVLLLFSVLALSLPAVAHACPTCYGAPNSAMTRGSNNGILFMLGIIGIVQVGFVALFWSFWKRAKAMRAVRDSFHVIEGGR